MIDSKHGFCGWYYRVVSDEYSVSLIAASHNSTGSLQLITDDGKWEVGFDDVSTLVDARVPRAILGNGIFSENGVVFNYNDSGIRLAGKLVFFDPTPIAYDIMGPFKYVPFMECRHSIVSMRHFVSGRITAGGKRYDFQNADGYIEGDRGRSFPKRYVWTQAFFNGGSLMLSVAYVPLGPLAIPGAIAVVAANGREYRLATYLGARVDSITDDTVVIRQGSLVLTARLLEKNGSLLKAPVQGKMDRMIRESVRCRARYSLVDSNRVITAFETENAAFEFEW